MAASITVDKTIAFVQPFLNWAPLTIGTASEPAMTAANLALQTIMGPPFVWPWNRTTVSFLASQGVQDYNVSLTQFGYLESATLQMAGSITSAAYLLNVSTYQAVNNFSALPNGGVGVAVTIKGCTSIIFNGNFVLTGATPTSFTVINAGTVGFFSEVESGALALAGTIMPLELKWGSLGEAIEQSRPTFISTQSSNESGVSFMFRIMPVADTTYQIILNYQESPVPLVVTSNTWGVPDHLQYLYTYFFMFLMMDYFDDPRAARYRQLAVAGLLSRQKGLSETDRNLFLGNWLPLMQEEMGNQESSSQATQARGL